MKQIVEAINNKYAALGTALPCELQDDHLNQLGALQCCECYPFSTDTCIETVTHSLVLMS